jgi:hypothetical protein
MQATELENEWKMGKIDLIKMLRATTNLGLKEAKDAVEDYIYLEALPYPKQAEIRQVIHTFANLKSMDLKRVVARRMGLQIIETPQPW